MIFDYFWVFLKPGNTALVSGRDGLGQYDEAEEKAHVAQLGSQGFELVWSGHATSPIEALQAYKERKHYAAAQL